MEGSVDKAFEARLIAMLDQQGAELRTINIQMIGLMAAVALIGLGLWQLGKAIEK
jgi:cytochrome oxidase assembly protein ShyY1